MSDKIFTRDFKEMVLSCLVQDKNFLREAVAVLKPEYMQEQILSLAVEAIFNSYRRDGVCPSRIGLLNELVNLLANANRTKDKAEQDSLALLPAQELLSKIYKPLETPLNDVKEVFLHYCRTKEMQLTIVELYQKLDKGELDHQAVMESVRKTYIRSNVVQDVGLDFFKEINDLSGDLERMSRKRLTSGFPSIDSAMGGGMTTGTLTTIIGGAKAGKSMSLQNTAIHNLVRGYCVVLFTMEISAKKYKMRFASRISGTPMDELLINIEHVMDQCGKFNTLHKGRLIIKEYPTNGATVDSLRSYLYWLEGAHGLRPDVIVIDYADLLRSSTKILEERLIQKNVYEDLRGLANEFDCAIITASQCNRDGVSKQVIRMDDIAESFAKVQVSDHILTLCQTDVEKMENRMRVFFAGSREARTGQIIPLRCNWPTCYMSEVEKEKANSETVRNEYF